ncbi:MAG TPA: xanthine dehydrogenase molybdopterin binding subunit [Geminicoccus sp.]|jgi:xanthine dehydrogenase large subunit|uniref:xanthine dehydrogenase molybdopterin binding subunit n=1 Tax=Geminicoccus sp. TaxID=2024832 RepID=UPI002E365798|nr:xanthine dehydrogenase molybdopterin binding subunit [Geminicoccus sp.]HEX2525646.1 xanthine dehydrogenase molybdopterin binding subunit [Geminicoccus sp.]
MTRIAAAHAAIPHDSAQLHVTGRARYVDDLPEPQGCLHAAVGQSKRAHARIVRMDLSRVAAAPGVVAVLTGADIPGSNQIGPVLLDEPALAQHTVEYAGQAMFAVAATSYQAARKAVLLADIAYEDLPAAIHLEDALQQDLDLLPPHRMGRGEPDAAIARAPHVLTGRFRHGGQDHFYLEGQIALAVPTDDGGFDIHSSTQHPTEVQHVVARCVGVLDAQVRVECRRMGGGFGGKETQANQIAAIAAVLAQKTGRAVKFRLDRDVDMTLTGKRHDFLIDYQVGFDDEGRIQGILFDQAARGGCSADLTGAIADRAMFHADNAYYFPHVLIRSRRMKTHTVSNTAFRGFGGPQGMIGIEEVIDEIARHLGRDPLDVRKANFYGPAPRNLTPYHMEVEDFVLPEMLAELEESSDYRARRDAIARWNEDSPILKRGLALTPVKFGISFTTSHLNQAGALIQLYTDGSVLLNHGGTEMGQGLYVKVQQVVAEELQIPTSQIRITAADTSKVPNTSATAASSGTDMNGMAAQAAARVLKERLIAFAAGKYGLPPHRIVFQDGQVLLGERPISLRELAKEAWMARVQLSATGFYATPKIHYDREKASGRPFFYFAYGAACCEAVIDTLTGENRILRADILHDVGRSLNPAIDLGQIEGAFVQGMGWLTTEELWWTKEGQLGSHAPSTYKIPCASDLPKDFRVRIWESGRNREPSVHRSKAVGEPPFMLAIAAFQAIKDAVAAAAPGRGSPRLDAPATPERVLFAVKELRSRRAQPVELPTAAE